MKQPVFIYALAAIALWGGLTVLPMSESMTLMAIALAAAGNIKVGNHYLLEV